MGAKCSDFIAASVDGFIARVDGDIEWLLVERDLLLGGMLGVVRVARREMTQETARSAKQPAVESPRAHERCRHPGK
jgi:hypothetical protein